MRKLCSVAGIVLVAVCGPAMALSEQDCVAAWTKADQNQDGFIQETEASRYFASLRVANKQVSEGRMTQAVFLEHCKAGLFTTAKVDAGAPLAGANSFTEAQAKDRVLAAGYGNISALVKDDNGIWRGTATDGPKQVKISVDYKGNVVATD